jgi:hypothetical protein
VAPADLEGPAGAERFRAETASLGLDALGDRALRRLFDVFAANTLALEAVAATPVEAPAVLILAREEADPSEVAVAWRPLAGDMELVVLPGSHYELLTQPNLATVVRAIAPRSLATTAR